MSYVDLIPSSNMFYGLAAQDYKKLVLEVVPSYADVLLEGANVVRFSASIAYAKPDDVVQWTASAVGYDTKTGTYTVTSSDTQTISIDLDVTQITTAISPNPSDATVEVSSTIATVTGTGTTSITADYGSEINYSVSHGSYEPASGSVEAYENRTINVDLTGLTLTVEAVNVDNSVIPDATIVLSAPSYEQVDNKIQVPGGTSVGYHIEATGYDTQSGTITVTATETKTITMPVSQITVGVKPVDKDNVEISTASVQLSTTTATISGTGTTATVVPYSTTVNYSVTDNEHGYISETGSVIATTSTTIPVELTKQKVSLSIDPTPTEATVNLTADGITSTTNNTIVDWGTEVIYDVSADHYVTTVGIVTTTSNTVIPVSLEKEKVYFTITPTGDGGVILSSAAVSMTSTTTTVINTGVTGITVPYESTVAYNVTNQGYSAATGSATVRNNENRTVPLTRTYATFAVTPTPSDATVVLESTTATVFGTNTQSITVPTYTNVDWEVKRFGYNSSSGSTLVASTTTIPVEIQPLQIPVTATAVSSEGGSAITSATVSITDGTVSVSGTTGTATTTVPWGSTMTCNATATGYNSVINRTFKVTNTQAYTQYLTMIPQYEELTIEANPSTATIKASHSTVTETATGTLGMTVRYGTVVSYEVSNEGFDTKTGTTSSIFESNTITVSLETTKVELTIVPDPVDSTVKTSYGTVTQTTTGTSATTVNWDTTVTCQVSRTGYNTETGSIPSIRADRTVAVSLTAEMYTFAINPAPSNATVTLTATGYTQSGNSITVPYNTPVDYSVTLSGYVEESGTYYVQEDTTLTVSLTEAGYFVLTGDKKGIASYGASDGSWSYSTVGPSNIIWYDAAKGSDRILAVSGNNGYVAVKLDSSTTWSTTPEVASGFKHYTAYGKGYFLVSEESGTIYTMSNGSNWSILSVTTLPNTNWHGIKYINNTFFLLGESSIVAYCSGDPTDSLDWSYTTFTNASSTVWYDIAYNNGVYVLAGTSGTIGYMSEDFSMMHLEGKGSSNWYSIVYGNGNFVLAGHDGVYYGPYSSDIGEVDWKLAWSGDVNFTDVTFYYVTYGAKKFVAVGNKYYFYESSNGKQWDKVSKSSHGSTTAWYGVTYVPRSSSS